MNDRFLLALSLLVWALFLATPCTAPAAEDYWPDDHWRTATPESQGVSSDILADMMAQLWQKNLQVDSVLIVRNGHVVLDTYQYPRTPDMKHDIYSCTKSISSTLIGIAIDKGYIQPVHQPMLGFFPHKAPRNTDRRKQAMTLADVLQMATGLNCRDSIYHDWAGLRAMRGSTDWVQYMLDLPMVEKPGVRFDYCNGASFLLTAIIQEATGQSGLAFAQEHLFRPLGIHDIDWPANSRGQTIGWGQLHMRPRDMARFGYLFLQKGRWKGRQVVSARWVAEATRQHIPVGRQSGYGYQWWVMDSGDYMAIGYGGQRIYISPENNMVVVFTARLNKLTRFLPANLLQRYILPAVKSDRPLPPNETAFNRLTSLDRFWQTADYVARDAKRQALAPGPARPQWQRYRNKRLGFSFVYDADLDDSGVKRAPPVLFQKSGLTGFPVVTVVGDDIPDGLELGDSEDYLVGQLAQTRGISDIQIKHKEIMRLPDGSSGNYCQLKMKYLGFNFSAYGMVAYRADKLIGVMAVGGGLEAPFADLEHMVRSLRLEKSQP